MFKVRKVRDLEKMKTRKEGQLRALRHTEWWVKKEIEKEEQELQEMLREVES